MHQAIEVGDEDAIVQWLKDEKGSINKYKGGIAIHRHFAVGNGTALHWAVYYGQQNIAKLLLDTGAGNPQGSKLLFNSNCNVHDLVIETEINYSSKSAFIVDN